MPRARDAGRRWLKAAGMAMARRRRRCSRGGKVRYLAATAAVPPDPARIWRVAAVGDDDDDGRQQLATVSAGFGCRRQLATMAAVW
uniref:Uncharacterized protein n=1 Tax=Oryza glaberrima TaxID=4538 RepID=I1R341_ORYGL